MKNISGYHLKHTPIITWLILPLILCLLGFNYIIGTLNKPVWMDSQTVKAEVFQTQINLPTGLKVTGKYRLLSDTTHGFITLWFDDAWESQYINALPVLREFHLAGALSVPTRAIGSVGYMNWNTVRSLDRDGWEIATHSRTHTCDISTLTKEAAFSETFGAKDDLALQGISSDIFVTPCSSDSPLLKTYIKKSHLALRTGSGGFNPVPVADPYNIFSYSIQNNSDLAQIRDLINRARTDKTWLVLMFHQIDSTTGEFSLTPEYFRTIVKAVADSQVPVVLPTEVLSITGN